MSHSKVQYKIKRKKRVETNNEEVGVMESDAGPVNDKESHLVERGRKKFDWSKAFDDKKKKLQESGSEGRHGHTSKSDTGADSGEELEARLKAIKLSEKKVDEDVINVESDVPELTWQENTSEPKLPAMKIDKESDESEPENTWGSASPPGPSCGSLLRFVEQFEKESVKKPEEVVKYVNGCVVRVTRKRTSGKEHCEM